MRKTLSIIAIILAFTSFSHAALFLTAAEYKDFTLSNLNKSWVGLHTKPSGYNSFSNNAPDDPGVSGKSAANGKTGSATYNSYEKDRSMIHNIAAKVSLLAPPVDVLFDSGRIDSTLITDSVKGQDHLFDQEARTTVVPEPSTITVFLKGTTILLGFNKKI